MQDAVPPGRRRGIAVAVAAVVLAAALGLALWLDRGGPGRPATLNPAPEIPAAALPPPPAAQPQPWRHEEVFSVEHFGRYAVAAVSPVGTAVQCVDRMAGPGPADGVPGKRDGRVDVFLGPGQHQAVMTGPPGGTAPVELKVVPFEELNPGTPPRLEELRTVATQLGDTQQRSYWLDIPRRRTVFIEAAGRYLADLRLWRDGAWLVDAAPEAEEVTPHSGQPLAVRRLVADLQPGLYLITAYGGPGLVWSQGGAGGPLYLRLGVPTLPAAFARRFTAGPLGRDRWLVPRGANHFRLEIPESGTASVEAAAWDGGQPGDGETAVIDKTSRFRAADLAMGDTDANGRYLVTVTRPAGQPYRLDAYDSTPERRFEGSGTVLFTPVDPGSGEDDLDLTAVLSVPDKDGERVIQSAAVPLSPERGWKRRFNLPDQVTLFLDVAQAGRYRLESDGVDAEFAIAPLVVSGDAAPPTPVVKAGTFDLAAGLQVLTITPRSESRGIVTVTLKGEQAPDPASLSPRLIGALAPVQVRRGITYTLRLGRTGRDGGGAILRKLPLDLGDSDALLPLAAGGQMRLPVTVPAAGRLALAAEDGTSLPLAIDGAPAGETRLAAKGAATVTVGNPRGVAVLATLGFTADAPEAAPPPLPPLPPERLAALPRFPDLAAGQTRFLDLRRRQSATFAVTVAQPALYRIETTGLLQTGGTLSTQTIPSLARASANGIGRNFLIQRYLGAGLYQLTVAPEGATQGHLGVGLAATAVEDAGRLVPGVPARLSLGAGEGAAYVLDVAEPGTYHVEAASLAGGTAIRLEDGGGWPLTTPDQGGSLRRELQPGRYRVIVLPRAMPARLVTTVERIVPPPVFTGHGPHPLPLDGQVANRWEEPAQGGQRVPDSWTFTLPAAATVSLGLGDGMAGALRQADGGTMAALSFRRKFVRRLPAGAYRLEVETERPDNRFDYTITCATRELTVGRQWRITAPAEIPVAIGADGLVEIASFGGADVRATLVDPAGREVARDDDRPDDWNFLIAARLAAGDYTLRVEPVGEGTAATTVRVSRPREVADRPLALPASLVITDDAMHILPLDLPPAGALMVAAARSRDAVGLMLERRGADGLWLAAGSAFGHGARLALARDPAAAIAYRLRVWSLDHGGAPITLTAAATDPQVLSERSLADGVELPPLPGFDPPLAAAMVALKRPGLLRLSQGSDRLAASTGPDGRTLARAAPVLAAGGKAVWLLDDQGARVALRRVVPDATPLALTLGDGERAVLPLDGAEGGPLLWIAESRVGQPGLAVGPLDAVADARGSGAAAGTAVAVLPGSRPPPDSGLRLWRADEAGGDLPLTLRQIAFARGEAGTLGWGMIDDGAAAGTAREFALPAGIKRLRLALPPGTAAALLAGGEVTRTLWPGNGSVAETLDTAADRLLLLNTTAGPVRFSALLAPVAAGAEPLRLTAGTLVRQWQAESGSLRTELEPGGRTLTLTLAGAAEDGLLLQKDGTVRQGRVLAVTGDATLEVRHRPGLVALWLDSADDTAWPAAAAALPAPAVPGTAPLSGPQAVWRFDATAPGLVHLAADGPMLSGVRRPGAPPEVAAWPQGIDLHVFLPAGATVIGLRPLAGGGLSGPVTLARSEPVAIGEGLGPPTRLAPGDARLFTFVLAEEGPVGLGIKGGADTARLRLLDDRGRTLAEGVVAMRVLAPGRYFLLAENRADAPPVEIRPALVGLDRPGTGPPEEVRRQYWQLVSEQGDK